MKEARKKKKRTMIRHLFDIGGHRLYRSISMKNRSIELFRLSKLDVFMRLVIAFHHGFYGILYDDQHDLDKIQATLDSMFDEKIYCRRLWDGTTVLYPHYSYEPPWPWSFWHDGQFHVDFHFSSQEPFEKRMRLMKDLRLHHRQRVVRLFDLAFLTCSTHEQSWIRHHVLSP